MMMPLHRKFARQVTSLRNAMKAAVLGGDGQDFAVGDLFSSEYDLPYAAKHFRFALMPKISSELQSVDNLELLAHDEPLYNEWVKALKTVAKYVVFVVVCCAMLCACV